MRFVAVALLTLLLAACSEPRIDATSEATLDASIAKVRETLAVDERNQFDTLVAQTRADDAADESPTTSATPSRAFASINNMTGAQAIDALRKLAEQRAELRATAEDARRAEQAARETKELAALSAKSKTNAASLERLRSIEVTDLRPEIRRAGMRRSYGITANIRNTLDAPLASIGFDYSVRHPVSGAMLGTGSGEFVIKDALKPGESRTLEASSAEGGEAFAEAVKAMDEHRKAVLAVTITGATRADGTSVLAPSLTAAEEKRLGSLRAGADSAAKR
jgi:hypothetical protein